MFSKCEPTQYIKNIWTTKWENVSSDMWATSWQNQQKWHVRPAKTQISLGIRPVWSESSLCAQWVAKDPSFQHADSEDSDQPGRMPRLIWVFAGRTYHFVGFVMRWLICAQRRQISLISLRCPHEETLHPWPSKMYPDTNQTVWMSRLI